MNEKYMYFSVLAHDILMLFSAGSSKQVLNLPVTTVDAWKPGKESTKQLTLKSFLLDKLNSIHKKY